MNIKHSIIAAALLMTGAAALTGCSDGDDFDYDKNGLLLTGTEKVNVQKFVVEDTPLTSSLKKHVFYNLLINNIMYLCVT